jgi:hypothetical protein
VDWTSSLDEKINNYRILWGSVLERDVLEDVGGDEGR